MIVTVKRHTVQRNLPPNNDLLNVLNKDLSTLVRTENKEEEIKYLYSFKIITKVTGGIITTKINFNYTLI